MNDVRGSMNLDRVYIMTNAEKSFLRELKERLLNEGWKSVVTSHDLAVAPAAVEVAVAADMEIGIKAEVFLGNGVSPNPLSLVSNRRS